MCPFQLLRSYKRHEENKRKIGQERSSMQQANVIGPLHECKKVCPCTKTLPQSAIRAWIKQGWRKRKKRGRKDRGQEADGKKKKRKKKTEELKKGLPRHSWGVLRGGALNFPSHSTAPNIHKSKKIFSFTVLAKFSTYT